MNNRLRSLLINRRRRIAVGVVSVLAGTLASISLLAVSSALAAGPPVWPPGNPTVINVHSTRVLIRMELLLEELATKWKAEYAPAVCNGQIPGAVPSGKAPENGWTIANEAEFPHEQTDESTQIVYIGAQDPDEEIGAPIQLRHLKPETCYYARFLAENSDSKLNTKDEVEPTATLVPFKTLPVKTPEIPVSGEIETGSVIFQLAEPTDNGVEASAKIETNGSDTEYNFEYALPEGGHAPLSTSGSWKVFSSGATGHISSVEDFVKVRSSLSGLSAETRYYVRIKLSNEKGTVYQTRYSAGVEVSEFFVTGTAKPQTSIAVGNVTGVSAHLSGFVHPSGSRTVWRFEYAESGSLPSETSSLWKLVPGSGAEGEITQEQAAATSYFAAVNVGVGLSGLVVSSHYFVRLVAENGVGGASGTDGFETEGAPVASTFAIGLLAGESVSFQGAVNPNAVPTSAEQSVVVNGASGGAFSLKFEGHETSAIAYDATSESVERALNGVLEGLPGRPSVAVEGVAGGPYTVIFGNGGSAAGSAQPLLEADGSGLVPAAPASSASVLAVQRGGETNKADYWFQYASDKAFAEHGWEDPGETAHTEAASGVAAEIVSASAPGLAGGEGYHYRVAVSSTLPGTSLILGNEEELTAPSAPVGGSGGACPNEAFRTGLAAGLPDCRSYEQLTPVEKGSAQEPFHYRGGIESAVLAGEGGEHAVLEAPEVDYGSDPGSGQSPYLFSRGVGGWSMTAGAPQPETGVGSVTPQVYSADLTQLAFESAYAESEHSESPEVAYKIGPTGGPYKTVASVPRNDVKEAISPSSGQAEGAGWVAGDGDFSKLVLQTRDRGLLGGEAGTGTKSGSDLYEYTPQGGLKQLNVTESEGETVTIGSCGAKLAIGQEDPESSHTSSSPNSVSERGAYVFFEAVPGKNCSAPSNLFVRIGGERTVDVGPYKFVAADRQGTRVLLRNDGTGELAGYNMASEQFEAQPTGELAEDQELEALSIPVRIEPKENNTFARPRYVYWQTEPVGSEAPIYLRQGQVYRYDDVEHLVECVSCASPSDPDPTANVYLEGIQGLPLINGGLPTYTAVSGNGEFAFFTTVAALVPQDVDGEIPVEHTGDSGEFLDATGNASPSTDVYEWRAAGVNGCGAVQGCVALITDGRGGYLNLLLGTADEGRDVFIYTRSVLSPAAGGVEGSIGEGNIYDVRVDGGFAPPPPRPTECEADACSTPPNAPNDPTPSSLTFTGAGNVLPAVTPAPGPAKPKAETKPKPKKGKPKKKQAKVKGKVKRRRSRAKGSAHVNRRAR